MWGTGSCAGQPRGGQREEGAGGAHHSADWARQVLRQLYSISCNVSVSCQLSVLVTISVTWVLYLTLLSLPQAASRGVLDVWQWCGPGGWLGLDRGRGEEGGEGGLQGVAPVPLHQSGGELSGLEHHQERQVGSEGGRPKWGLLHLKSLHLSSLLTQTCYTSSPYICRVS